MATATKAKKGTIRARRITHSHLHGSPYDQRFPYGPKDHGHWHTHGDVAGARGASHSHEHPNRIDMPYDGYEVEHAGVTADAGELSSPAKGRR